MPALTESLRLFFAFTTKSDTFRHFFVLWRSHSWLLRRDSSRRSRAQLAYPRCKQTWRQALVTYFFSCTKCTKNCDTRGAATSSTAQNKTLAPNWVRSFKNALAPRSPAAGSFFMPAPQQISSPILRISDKIRHFPTLFSFFATPDWLRSVQKSAKNKTPAPPTEREAQAPNSADRKGGSGPRLTPDARPPANSSPPA